jgi:hypothetical protein
MARRRRTASTEGVQLRAVEERRVAGRFRREGLGAAAAGVRRRRQQPGEPVGDGLPRLSGGISPRNGASNSSPVRWLSAMVFLLSQVGVLLEASWGQGKQKFLRDGGRLWSTVVDPGAEPPPRASSRWGLTPSPPGASFIDVVSSNSRKVQVLRKPENFGNERRRYAMPHHMSRHSRQRQVMAVSVLSTTALLWAFAAPSSAADQQSRVETSSSGPAAAGSPADAALQPGPAEKIAAGSPVACASPATGCPQIQGDPLVGGGDTRVGGAAVCVYCELELCGCIPVPNCTLEYWCACSSIDCRRQCRNTHCQV